MCRPAPRSAALGVAAAIAALAPALPSAQSTPGWVARSNELTRVVLEAQGKLAPEGAAQLGVSGVDEQITDLRAGFSRRVRASLTNVQQELRRRLTAGKDPLVSGVDLPPAELATIAHKAFNEIQAEIKPFMPREGQLISLQHCLLPAARAFSDPELQLGRTTPKRVKQLLMEDVVLSDAMATQEVERYTFRAPGQATSHFYGYSRLLQPRTAVERALGARFDPLRFHDFVLGQGLLPPGLLRKAVMQEFVPSASR